MPHSLPVPLLVNGCWQLAEFVFLEYRTSKGVAIKIGPFPKNPDDDQTEKAYRYLAEASPSFLTLGETEWTLDLDKLLQAFPQIQREGLDISVSHPPAFEMASEPREGHLINGQPVPAGVFFLQIPFTRDTDSLPSPEPSPDLLRREDKVDDHVPEEASSDTPHPQDASDDTWKEDIRYFYSPLSPEACRQKLEPYVTAAGSSIIPASTVKLEFSVTLKGTHFCVRRAGAEIAQYRSYLAGTLSPRNDGGTLIVAEYGTEATDFLKSLAPYAGVVLGLGMGASGFQWAQRPEIPFSKVVLAGGLVLGGVFSLFMSSASLSGNKAQRSTLKAQDEQALLDFLQQTLNAETVERAEPTE